MFNSFDTSVSGLVAHRVWMDTISSNIANMRTTRDEQGRPNPYQRRAPLFTADGRGVRVAEIDRQDKFTYVDDPDHPDAIKSGPMAGFVKTPDISMHVEVVNAMVAQRAYEANLTALRVSKQMYMSDLRILG